MSATDQTPLVTIAMPVFNGGTVLRSALASIVEQTFDDWELLLIDDGSSDGAIASLKDTLDARIRIVSDGANLGLAARLNQAVEMALGKYFARMDHDDIAHPERLARQISYMDANPATDLLGAKCVAISNRDEILGEIPFRATHAEICERPWLGFYLAHPTWFGRTDWFRQHRYAKPAPFRCEDQDLLLRAHTASTYHALDRPLLAYRMKDNVNLKSLLRTRLALGGAQLRYFGGRRDFTGVMGASAAMMARMAKDIVRPPTGDAMSGGARSVSPEEMLWWQDWIRRVTQLGQTM